MIKKFIYFLAFIILIGLGGAGWYFSGLIYILPVMLLTLYYNFICFDLYKFAKNKFDPKKAKKVFGYSILYLFLIFVLFLIDYLI